MKTIKIGKRCFIVMSENEYEKRREIEDKVTINLKCMLKYLYWCLRRFKDLKKIGAIDMEMVGPVVLEHKLEHISELVIEADELTDGWYDWALKDDFYRKKLKEML